jgi:hypothetical protein
MSNTVSCNDNHYHRPLDNEYLKLLSQHSPEEGRKHSVMTAGKMASKIKMQYLMNTIREHYHYTNLLRDK